MRPNFIKSTVVISLCASFAASASFAADWQGSYSANGQCFCAGELDPVLGGKISPTPIGGQTVAQICQRIGEGPGLKLDGGVFNYPVYSDPQCGHGPFNAGSPKLDSNCMGSLDGKIIDSNSCQQQGPKWDIKQAFLKKPSANQQAVAVQGIDEKPALVEDKDPVVLKNAVTSVTPNAPTSLLNKPVVTSISVKRAGDVDGTTKTLKATVISSASTAGRKLPKREALDPFTGKILKIDGRRYMQARADFPVKGGEVGSRIVVDGKVFLLDDGSIETTDLYRGKVKKPAKKSSGKLPVKKSTTSVKKNNVPSSVQKSVVTVSNEKPSQRLIIPSPSQDSAELDRNHVPRAESITANTTTIVKPNTASKLTPIPNTALGNLDQDTIQPYLDGSENTSNQFEELKKQSAESHTSVPASKEIQVSSASEELKNSQNNAAASQVGVLSALMLPPETPDAYDQFAYIEAMQVGFDVGGAGVRVKGSTESHSKFHYSGRIGVTDTYQEAMLGFGYYLTPSSADRVTMVLQAGVEYGSFSLVDDENRAITVDYSDTGLYLEAGARLHLNHLFELRGGLGYSSFFEGDLSMYGGVYWHMTRHLDLVSRFELGDNDLVGLGIRFYY